MVLPTRADGTNMLGDIRSGTINVTGAGNYAARTVARGLVTQGLATENETVSMPLNLRCVRSRRTEAT